MMMTPKDPDRTRQVLLEAAFWEMYQVGYQAASLDRILNAAGVTKGALYHHFKGKTELGYAVVEEVIADWIRDRWVDPLSAPGDPIDLIKAAVRANAEWAVESGCAARGCPLNNFTNEMSPLDEGFRIRLQRVLATWRDGFAGVLRRGQDERTVRPDIDPERMGLFIVGTLEGMTTIVKNSPNRELAESQLRAFFVLIEGLRADPVRAA